MEYKKKYFCKYLPVEGEIKEGDTALLGKVTITNIIDKEYLSEIKINKRLDEYTKVNLFLCSRDIKVGDKVYLLPHIELGEYEVKKSDVPDCVEWEGENVDVSAFFKVIGVISSDAVWVKEEDEFESDEVNFLVNSWSKISHELEEFNVTEEEYLKTTLSKYKDTSKIIQIKCPTCKNYH